MGGVPAATFASDNAAPGHPRALAALQQVNEGTVAAYGADPVTEQAADTIRSVFDSPDAEVLFTFTGTATAAGAIEITTTDAENHTSEPVIAQLTNVVPKINYLQVVAIERGQVYEVRGSVADEWSAGLTVLLTGLPSFGMGIEVTVGENGTFTYRFNVSRDAEGAIQDAGTVVAEVSDWFGASAEETFRFLPA